MFYRRFAKRAFDLVVALTALVVLSPLLAICAGIVVIHLGSPVLFRQRRPGQKGELFTILKFRTMRQSVDNDGRPSSDGIRLTGIGRRLRSLSLDELPELWNVVRGDMSLVGPRPLLPEYLPRYSATQARRHEVKPGITGWAQVNGRNCLSWDEKFDLDVWYVDHVAFALDLLILMRTCWIAIMRRGISEPGHATATEFMGTGH